MKTKQNWRIVPPTENSAWQVWTAEDETPGSQNNYVIADDIQAEDEARLLSASPELLAACIELSAMVAEMLPKAGPCGWGMLAVESAQAAIAKATINHKQP
jgi:hypothetical protein